MSDIHSATEAMEQGDVAWFQLPERTHAEQLQKAADGCVELVDTVVQRRQRQGAVDVARQVFPAGLHVGRLVERRHQGIGDVVPWERFRLATSEPVEPVQSTEDPTTTRRVGREGKVSFAAERYTVGVWLAGEAVEGSVANGLVSIHHRGVLVATHAQRHRPAKETAALTRKVKPRRPRPRQPTVGQSVTRKVDSSGNVSFAGHGYRIGRKHARRQVQVAVVGDTVEISAGGEVLKVMPIRHDRSRENGAFANAGGRPSRINAA
jgi:hypothetical protein